MLIDIGDRVRFKKKLPDRSEPALQHHIGWHGTPGWSEPITIKWSEYFGGLTGVVVGIDVVNDQACVRGIAEDKSPYTIWIDSKYLDIVEQGVPR